GAPDVALDGTETPVAVTMERWPLFPNPRFPALLERSFFQLRGDPDTTLRYTVDCATKTSKGSKIRSVTRILPPSDDAPVALDYWDQDVYQWPTPPVHRELPLMVSGNRFTETLTANGYFEVLEMTPQFRGAA